MLRPSLAILQDSLAESTETLRVVLENPSSNCALGTLDTALVIILDDESPRPVFAFTQAHYHAFEGQGPVQVSVTCTGCTNEMGLVTVSARAVDGTARAGTEYVAQTTQLVFDAWHTRNGLTVDLIDDGGIESDKAFTIQLFDPTHEGLVAPPEAVAVEILDDDSPVQPPTIAMPLQMGSRWIYNATVSHTSEVNDWTVYDPLVGTLDKRVHFQGDEYLRLNLVPASGFITAQILLRQSGDSFSDARTRSFRPVRSARL